MSNSAGTKDDLDGKEARLLEAATGVKVFKHSTKKPGCGMEVFNYLRMTPELGVKHPSQVAVVGDRLFTDIMMANMIGAWAIWIKDGVVMQEGPVSELRP